MALSELDELTLRAVALCEQTTVAEQRRQAVHDWCTAARRNKQVAVIVAAVMAHRAAQRRSTNVIQFHSRR